MNREYRQKAEFWGMICVILTFIALTIAFFYAFIPGLILLGLIWFSFYRFFPLRTLRDIYPPD